MKRLVTSLALVGILSLSFPASSNAFFNRDCSNLKKRVAANQVKYEKAWNVYQQVLADWINSKPQGTDLWRTHGPVMNRFKQVGTIQITIMDDLIKYPKCIKGGSSGAWLIEKQNLNKLLNSVDYMALYFNNYFASVYDYNKTLK